MSSSSGISVLENATKSSLISFCKSLSLRASTNYKPGTLINNLKNHFNNDNQTMVDKFELHKLEQIEEQVGDVEMDNQSNHNHNNNINDESNPDAILCVEFSGHHSNSNQPFAKDVMKEWVKNKMKDHVFCKIDNDDGTKTNVTLRNEVMHLDGPIFNGKRCIIKKVKLESKRFYKKKKFKYSGNQLIDRQHGCNEYEDIKRKCKTSVEDNGAIAAVFYCDALTRAKVESSGGSCKQNASYVAVCGPNQPHSEESDKLLDAMWCNWIQYGNMTVDNNKGTLEEKEAKNIETVREKARKEKSAIGNNLHELLAQKNAGDITAEEFTEKVAALATNIITK